MINPINVFGNLFFKKSLERTGPVRTFARLCTSTHLEDLQWIATLVIVFWALGLDLLVAEGNAGAKWQLAPHFAISFGGLTTAAATALTWAYQTGCKRIGAVDLFGCEISVICRVCLVVEFARSSLELPDATKRPLAASLVDVSPPENPQARQEPFLRFTSEEHYTPVYDTNLSDLQPLDAMVVTNVTEFYTYRKTMMDFMRRIATETPGTGAWRRSTVQMIYMQFLMLESARKAVIQLIEFEPNQAESVINILCSEIILYRFLWHEYRQPGYRGKEGEFDFRFARLALREAEYREEVPALLARTTSQTDENWHRAQTTAKELQERYHETFSATGVCSDPHFASERPGDESSQPRRVEADVLAPPSIPLVTDRATESSLAT